MYFLRLILPGLCETPKALRCAPVKHANTPSSSTLLNVTGRPAASHLQLTIYTILLDLKDGSLEDSY